MDNDEFVKLIKKIGKIKPVEEAFKEFPVEEEEHKGKIDFYLAVAEENEEYSLYNVGDIVYVKEYQYENGEKGENHLFVIIGKDNLAVPIEYFGMLISSKIYKTKYKENKFLPKDKLNNLHVDSIVKTDEVYHIQSNTIAFKIGRVDDEKVEEYKESYLSNNK